MGKKLSASARPVGIARQLLTDAAVGWVVLALACSGEGWHGPTEPSDETPPSSPVNTMRVRHSAGDGEVERFADPKRPAKILAAFEALRPDFEARLRAVGAPGFAWGLVIDDQLAAAGGSGQTRLKGGLEVSPSTVFRIGSITKLFTALSVLQLRDRGLLSLDEPMLAWLPAFEGVVYPSADSALITPRHLLTHTSGLPRLGRVNYTTPDQPPSEAALLAALDGVELVSVPGQSNLYSNFGVSLLGPVVSHLSGQPYEQYVTARVLEPLGMDHTYWDAAQVPFERLARPHLMTPEGDATETDEWAMGAASAAGGLYSSIEDLARFAAFELRAWPARNTDQSPVLSRASLRESQQPQVVEELIASQWEDGTPLALLTGNGLGWLVQRDCQLKHVAWHNGGTEGHRAALYLLPQRGVALMAMANLDGANLDAPLRDLLRQLAASGALSRRTLVPTYSEEWSRQVNLALEFDEDTTEEDYQALFGEGFSSGIPLEVVVDILAGLRGGAEHCEVAEALNNGDPLWVAASVECDDVPAFVVEAVLGPEARIEGMQVTLLDDFEAQEPGAGSAQCPLPEPTVAADMDPSTGASAL